YCSECYQNTEEERKYIDSLREAPNDDYSNIIEQLYRVNKTTFIYNDKPILFNNDPWLHYKFDVIQDKHNLKAIINDKKLRKQVQGLYGVLITVSEATDKEQGFQIILNFVKVKNKGYQM